jgi:hypothetical protein
LDGDRILDEDEQRRMQEDLEGQKVNVIFFWRIFIAEKIPGFLQIEIGVDIFNAFTVFLSTPVERMRERSIPI